MNKPNHTAGPWLAEYDGNSVGDRWKITAPTPRPPRRYTVAVVVNHNADDRPIAETDARLLAEAPAMYEELVVVRSMLRYVSDCLAVAAGRPILEEIAAIDVILARVTPPGDNAQRRPA